MTVNLISWLCRLEWLVYFKKMRDLNKIGNYGSLQFLWIKQQTRVHFLGCMTLTCTLPPPPSKSPSHDKHNQSARKVEASGSLPHDSAECNAYDGTVPSLYGVWFLVCGWGGSYKGVRRREDLV